MARSDDPYGDILADRSVGGIRGAKRLAESYPQLRVESGLVLLHRSTGTRGRVLKFTGELVVLIDPRGREFTFENHPGAFAHRGETVHLVHKPRPVEGDEPRLQRSAAGALVDRDAKARTARASRIWVEGDHDARLIERVWGDELRELGIVVEPLGGIDDLVAETTRFGPSQDRRLAVLVDHLVPGSKETRIVSGVDHPDVLIVGHPYVDIWQCVRPKALGIDSWPEVPRDEDWKTGVCSRLGWGTPQEGWRRVLAAVDGFADLESSLIGAIEEALDMLTEGEFEGQEP